MKSVKLLAMIVLMTLEAIQQLKDFVLVDAKCSQKCCSLFKVDEIRQHHLQLKELDYYDSTHINRKNQCIIGQFAAMYDSAETT